MTASRAGSVVLGFLGVLVIVRPGLASFQPMALLVLFAALTFAISLIVTKKLTGHVSTFAIIFWMNVMQLPMALAWPRDRGDRRAVAVRAAARRRRDPADASRSASSGLTSHYCLTNAFRSGDATVVVPLDFLRIPLIALVGWMFYGEALDVFVFAGAGLIICGVLWNLHAESRRSVRLRRTRKRPRSPSLDGADARRPNFRHHSGLKRRSGGRVPSSAREWGWR